MRVNSFSPYETGVITMYHIKDDKRSKTSSELIYNALSQLLKEKNFDDIKITEVVEVAQVGRATFYRNFDHLEDVLHFKCDQKFEELYYYLKHYFKNEQSIQYSFFITPFLKFWYPDSEIVEELMKAKRFKLLIDAFSSLLKRGVNEKNLQEKVFSEHIGYFLAIRSSIAISTLVQWIRDGKDLTPEQISDIISEQMNSDINQSLFKD